MTSTTTASRILLLAMAVCCGVASASHFMLFLVQPQQRPFLVLGALVSMIGVTAGLWGLRIGRRPRWCLLLGAALLFMGSLIAVVVPASSPLGTIIALSASAAVVLTLTATLAQSTHNLPRWRSLHDAAFVGGWLAVLVGSGFDTTHAALIALLASGLVFGLAWLCPTAPDSPTASLLCDIAPEKMRSVWGFGLVLGFTVVVFIWSELWLDTLKRFADLAIGLVLGQLATLLIPHPFRQRAVVPVAAVVLAAIYVMAGWNVVSKTMTLVMAGFALGMALTVLFTAIALDGPADTVGRRVGYAFLVLAISVLSVGLVLDWLSLSPLWLACLLIAFAILELIEYRRPLLELLLEPLFTLMYRVSSDGPGLAEFPRHGPLVIVCNHSAWCDPFWVGQVVPRPIVPMMTSRFYDLPVIRWLMKHVVGSIRVQLSEFRREAPELEEAVAVLDRGGVLVVFPEGALKRSAEQPLRRFGRGIWAILATRPETPVMTCWIEGGWGSYTSYFNGPPTKNKRPDVRRPIQLALSSPQPLDPDLLADQRATRARLMCEVAANRSWLGLPPIASADSAEEPAESDEQ